MEEDMLDGILEEPLYIKEVAYFDKIYYLFDRHRVSFLCWLRAFQEGYISKNNLLITIDKHCDFFINDLNKKHITLARSLDFKAISKNIKDNNKQDFIVMAMEAEIIGDVIIISPIINKSEFPNGLSKIYQDSNKHIHNITYFSSIEEFESKFNNSIKNPLVLDIDLDYFQTHIINSNLPIKKWKYTKRSTKEQRKSYFGLKTKLNKIFQKTKIITLAEEMKYSQGKGKKWAEELLRLFFYLEKTKRCSLQ